MGLRVSTAFRTFSRACDPALIWFLIMKRAVTTTHLVEHDVICAAEGAAPLLKYFTDRIDLIAGELSIPTFYRHTYTDLLANLLVDDDVDKRAGSSNSLVGGDEVLERQRADKLLNVGLAARQCEYADPTEINRTY